MKKTILLMLFMISASYAEATTWFNPPVVTLVDAPHASMNAHAADINTNMTGIITDGNTAIANILSQIAGLGTSGVPTAALQFQNSAICPVGYSIPNGTNGTPNWRGYYVRALDSGAGRDAGRTLASLQGDTFIQHSHGTNTFMQSANFLGGTSGTTNPDTTSTFSGSTTGVNSSSTETRPTTVVLQFCLKGITGGGSGGMFFSPSPVNLSANIQVPHAADLMADFNQIIADGNTTFNNLQTAINNITGGAVPSGTVAFFNLGSCPTGWVASNGSGGTLDTRGRFPVPGASLGTVTSDSIINHSHELGSYNAFLSYPFTSSNLPSGGLGYFNSINFGSGTSNAVNGNFGTETRPKNVALLGCQKS